VETIKTAIVVVLLLAVLYGVYVVLNKPELEPPPEVALQQPLLEAPDIKTGIPDSFGPLPSPVGESTMPLPPALGVAESRTETGADLPRGPVAGPADIVAVDSPDSLRPGGSFPPPDPTGVPGATADDAQPIAQVGAIESVSRTLGTVDDDMAHSGVSSGQDRDSQPSIYESPSAPNSQNDDTAYRSVRAFDSAWSSAVAQLEKGQLSEALLTLSFFYDDPSLEWDERQRLIDLLDPLAGKVIYSNESHLEAPYQIKSDETLYDVAERFQIPVALLQNINGISNPDTVWPGTTIKVLRGPFRAEVDIKQSKLVLFLGKYYAGQFPISAGNDPAPQPAEYEVRAKQPGCAYTATDGRQIPARAPDNPYGDWWIDLGQGVSIHGVPQTIPQRAGLGCVSLESADASDVYGILSVRSKVLIR
jgi:LysM repeat protein